MTRSDLDPTREPSRQPDSALASVHPWQSVRTAPSPPGLDGLVRRPFAGEGAVVMHNMLTAGSVVPVHDHPEEQFTVMVSGRMRFAVVIGDETVESEAGPDEIVHLPGGRPHGAVALEDCVFFDVFTPVRHELLTD